MCMERLRKPPTIPRALLKHCNTSDCAWVVIDNKVYDVTPFLDLHPGGGDLILQATGAYDATGIFEQTHGEGLKYSLRILNQFYIGELEEESVNGGDKLPVFYGEFTDVTPSSSFLTLLRRITGALHSFENEELAAGNFK